MRRSLFMVLFVLLLLVLLSVLLLLPNDDSSEDSTLVQKTLSIAYDQPLKTYDPMISDTVTRAYLVNVYEGLVRFDRNFNIQPALALSWGMLSDTRWQFKLRSGVTFHDGSSFDAEDVVFTFERALSHPDSQIRALVASVEEIEIIDSFTIQLVTAKSDPTLLNRLTALFILPSTVEDWVDQPVGTGPYAFDTAVESEHWLFNRYESYWGSLPVFSELRLMYVPDKFQRYQQFLSGEIDVLAQVPPVFVNPLLEMGYQIATQPSLEVNFLLFGWGKLDSPFRHRALREAIAYSFDPEELARFTAGFAHPINQFVSRGVFGYSPDIEDRAYDLGRARELVNSLGDEFVLTLDLPEGLENFGDYVVQQLSSIGVQVSVAIWPYQEYAERISAGESDFFFLGWRSELGDAGDFFANVVHSSSGEGDYGTFNNGRYKSEGIDDLIEVAQHNLLESERLEQLQALMKIVVSEEILGIPLFESDVLTAIQPELQWEPRVDNLILATDFAL